MSEHITEEILPDNDKTRRRKKHWNLALKVISLGAAGLFIFFDFFYDPEVKERGTYVKGTLPEDFCEVYHATEEKAAAIRKASDWQSSLHHRMSTEEVVSLLGEPDQIFRVPYDENNSQGIEYRYWLKYDKSNDPRYAEHYRYEGLEVIFNTENRLVMWSLMNRFYLHRPDNTRRLKDKWASRSRRRVTKK